MAGAPKKKRAFRRLLGPGAFVLSLVPLLLIGYDAFLGKGLGANPIAEILNRLGFWTLTFLTITLACTPVKILLGIAWPLRLRRIFGLFTFFYACLHFTTYFAIDQFFNLHAIYLDIAKRKFIMLGLAALLLLIPLAATSTNGMVRRIGFSRWKKLHRLVYVVALLGLIHFYLRVKADHRQPLIFIGIVSILMAVRLADVLVKARRKAAAGSGRAGLRPDAADSRRPCL